MRYLLAFLLCASPLGAQRTYWPTSIDTMWVGHQKHTHAAIIGRVAYCRSEDDGDKHIKLLSLTDSTKFIVAEIIPLIPLPCPKAGTIITVRGITRYDVEHGWREVHAVESWGYN